MVQEEPRLRGHRPRITGPEDGMPSTALDTLGLRMRLSSAMVLDMYFSRQQCKTFARHQGTATAILQAGYGFFMLLRSGVAADPLTTPCQEDHAMAMVP